MNRSTLGRKIVYILAMVALLVPLFLLGQPPSARDERNAQGAVGGQVGLLATLRDRYDIGQSSLGELDPASETMRLASLGMRGVAATILWQKADYYKEEKYYDRLSATLNQLALLQPHFVSVWESQAHNMAYNVSAEFDDYRERYNWVKKGMDYLVRGTQFNRRQPILQWFLGKYMTQKLGRSDEKRQFRDLFRNDESYHSMLNSYGLDIEQAEARGSDRKPDNWLVGRLWFLKAYDLVQAGAYCKKTPLYFYAESPFAQLYYSEAIEEEGVLDDRALFAWNRAGRAWAEFGNRDIMTTWGHTIQLRGDSAASAAVRVAQAAFEAMTDEEQLRIIEENKDKLTEDEYQCLLMPVTLRSAEQAIVAAGGRNKIMPQALQIAHRMPAEQRSEAIRLANEWASRQEFAMHVNKYREMINYEYWETRAAVEQTPVAVAARRQVYEGDQALTQADLDKASTLYEVAWKNWDLVFRRYPMMMTEEIADDVIKAIDRYAKAVDVQLDETFPLDDFLRYRAVRDRNRKGEDSQLLYRRFVEAAEGYEGRLEKPFEPGQPEPTTEPSTAPSAPTEAAAVTPSPTEVTPAENMPPESAPAEEPTSTEPSTVEAPAAEPASADPAAAGSEERPPRLDAPEL